MVGWKSSLLLALVAAIAVLAAGCPSLDSRQDAADGTAAASDLQVIVTPLAPSNVTITDELEVASTKTEDGYDVVVTASAELPRTELLFARLDFGDAQLTAMNINVEAADGASTLGAAFPSGPTTLDIGLVPVAGGGEPVVLAAGATALTFSLKSVGPAAKGVSAASEPATARARNLSLVQEAGEWLMSWDYTNPGDSNQDGEVGVSDLKEIGQHFRAVISDMQNDPRRHVDADANGEINLADISSIGSNMHASIFAYNIEMSPDGAAPFETVGQLVLTEEAAEARPGETLRFVYRFVGQYVPLAWYRVVPVINNPSGGVLAGAPSEAISEAGRQLAGVPVAVGSKATVTVCAAALAAPLTHMNACRVIFPQGYQYVPNSFNAGAAGGARDAADGIWASFASTLLVGPDQFFRSVPLEDGRQAIDFNVTTLATTVSGSPVGYGDLFNFQLENVAGGALDLSFELGSPDGVRRTYYSQNVDGLFPEHDFGNTISFRVN